MTICPATRIAHHRHSHKMASLTVGTGVAKTTLIIINYMLSKICPLHWYYMFTTIAHSETHNTVTGTCTTENDSHTNQKKDWVLLSIIKVCDGTHLPTIVVVS